MFALKSVRSAFSSWIDAIYRRCSPSACYSQRFLPSISVDNMVFKLRTYRLKSTTRPASSVLSLPAAAVFSDT